MTDKLPMVSLWFPRGHEAVADLGTPFLSPIFFQFSCNFQQKVCQMIGWHQSPMGNPRSATDYVELHTNFTKSLKYYLKRGYVAPRTTN